MMRFAMGRLPGGPVGANRNGAELQRNRPDDGGGNSRQTATATSLALSLPTTAMVASRARSADVPAVDSPTRPRRLTPAQMYARVLAGDPAWNGRFFTGVLTTGIYCLPSCKARKPKLENVRFFPTCEAARAAGLRPCRKCHPDDYARGADPVLEAVERVVAEVRARPADFADARAIVQRLGFGTTRAFELFRLHYHSTPADVLLRARIAAARARLLQRGAGASDSHTRRQGDVSILEISAAVGFESMSAFHDNFRRLTGLTPAAYRDLRDGPTFVITLPPGYPLGYLRRALSRDAQSVSERLDGDTYEAAVRLRCGPAVLRLHLARAEVHGEVQLVAETVAAAGPGAVGWLPTAEAHAVAVGLIGLDEDAAGFARLAAKLGLGRLVAGREQLRISRTHSAFEGLLWAIIGQQINFAFACVLKRRLFELAGTPLPNGLVAPPTPAAVAALKPADLVALQFSRQKAAYLIDTANTIVRGELDLDGLAALSATRAERTLLAVRGLGPWSVNYVMMRALGFADCVPLGDTGVTSGLQRLLNLEERPDVDATRRLMAVFSPYRSLATAHLWQLDRPIPE
jgi:AraC family transcriptional regulator of adaptative response / DNA-3-methyladenine glycosylase II